MIVHYQGGDWELDPERITVDEWRELKRKYQMTPAAFERGITEADPDASTFAWWIMLRHSGQHAAPLGDHLKPDILALNAAICAAQQAEADPEPEPDPTQASPSTATSASPPAAPSPGQPEEVDATGS